MARIENLLLMRRQNPFSLLAKFDLSSQLFFKKILASLDTAILERTQYFNNDAIRAFQDLQFFHLVRFSWNSIPFWKKKINTLNFKDELYHYIDPIDISPLTRGELREAFPLCTAATMFPEAFYKESTSGSTGEPITFFGDYGMLNKRLAVRRRFLRWINKKPGKVIKIMEKDRRGLESEGILFPCRSPRQLEEKRLSLYPLISATPIILEGVTSFLVHLARLIEAENIFTNIQGIITFGEHVTPPERELLERVFSAPVFRYYASQEIGAIAQECEYHDGLHINTEWLRVEIVDDEGRAVPTRTTGRVLITMFENKVMPFIRYEIGDRAKFIPDACRCGRTLPRIEFEGRLKDTIALPNGRESHFLEIGPAFWKFFDYIQNYQIVQETIDSLYFYVVPRDSNFFTKSICQEIENGVTAILDAPMSVKVFIAEKVPYEQKGIKLRSFVSKIFSSDKI